MLLNYHRIAFTIRLLVLALVVPLAACKKSESPEKPSISVFASPDDASTALLAAAKSGDQNALLAIFGLGSKEVVYSGDAVQDKNAAEAFVAKVSKSPPLPSRSIR